MDPFCSEERGRRRKIKNISLRGRRREEAGEEKREIIIIKYTLLSPQMAFEGQIGYAAAAAAS